MSVKLEDVAKEAGVSKTTVSRVLNNRGYLSEETRKKVADAVKKLHYSPNAVARQLFKKETKIVGLIFPTIANPFFGQLVAELEKNLFNAGFKVFIGDSMNNSEKEKIYLEELIANQVDGLIIGTQNSKLEEYNIDNLPIVAIDKYINQNIPVISSDNYQGGKLATEALIKSGARKIILTDGPLAIESPAHDRRKAYIDVMKKHNLQSKICIIDFNWSNDHKIDVIKKMLSEDANIDAVFATNDIDAALIWNIAEEMGKKIPTDLKIVGYDHAKTTQLLLPKLTSVEQPISQMAKSAVATLLKRINKEKTPLKQIFPVNLYKGCSI